MSVEFFLKKRGEKEIYHFMGSNDPPTLVNFTRDMYICMYVFCWYIATVISWYGDAQNKSRKQLQFDGPCPPTSNRSFN